MSKMKTLKFLALTAIFVTLFTNSEMLFAQSGTYTTCFNCGGMGFITLYSPYGSYTTYCPGCGGTGQIKVPELKATDWWNYSGGGNNSGGNVPVNTYSGSYDNNNTNTKKTNNSGKKTCSFCGGTGWITNDDAPDFTGGTKWCSRCNKEVRMSHSHEKCPSCGGSGKSW